MEHFYIEQIRKNLTEYHAEYKQIVQEVVGRYVPIEELEQFEKNIQINIMCTLGEQIKIKRSRIDIDLMAHAIQRSRSGAGLTVMTDYICAFCGEEETWSNSNVPNICYECATEMATNMVMQNAKFLKTDKQQS